MIIFKGSGSKFIFGLSRNGTEKVDGAVWCRGVKVGAVWWCRFGAVAKFQDLRCRGAVFEKGLEAKTAPNGTAAPKGTIIEPPLKKAIVKMKL